MLLPRVFASSVALAASLRARPVCSAALGALPPVLDARGEALSPEAAHASCEGKRVALYFSAGWCPMCTRFEPSLQQFRKACDDSGKPVQIIYVPSDRSSADAKSRAAGMGVLQVPFEAADEYKKQFKVWAGAESMKLGLGRRSGVPALVVLDGDGKELGFVAAEAQGAGALQSWPLDDERGIW